MVEYDDGLPAAQRLAPRFPGARTVIVIGHGGGAFWAGFRAHCDRDPQHAARADPLDDYTRLVVGRALATVVPAAPIVYPFEFATQPVSFMRLATAAGLGRRGLVGVLLHPVFGPWIAFRAAVLLAAVVTAPRPAADYDPCPGCVERACIAACPGQVVTASGWDIPGCAAFRARADDPCAPRCHARYDCVVGREHRYPPDALAHHQGRARAVLLERR